MGYKKIKYNSGEGIVKIRIEEESGALMENWTIMFSDLGKWVSQMRRKYGSIVDGKRNDDKDLDWIR